MKLFIFDIDGTIVDSVGMDDRCFIQTFKDLYDLDLNNVDWNDFPHVTDSGLSIEILKRYFNRTPQEGEIETIQRHFHQLIQMDKSLISEVPGARVLIEMLHAKNGVRITFATGGWRSTALTKAETIGLDLRRFVFKSADDHFDRSKIVSLAWEESEKALGSEKFETITYVGDGLWDFRTAQELGIEFIGVDCVMNGNLKLAGVLRVINNYEKDWQLWGTHL